MCSHWLNLCMTTEVRAVHLDLAEPLRVMAQGRATHGVRRLLDEFQLPDLWSLHLYAYTAELEVDGDTYPVAPGTVSLVPPASLIRYRYSGPSSHVYAHLLAAAPEPRAADRTRWPLRMIMNPGTDLPAITDLMESAVDWAAVRPERTRADIWLALLRLAARHRDQPGRQHTPAEEHVARAMSYIERHLAEPLTVPRIARAVGVSHNHLSRLFSAETEHTVIGYLRQRRVEHARQLLSHSTMSIGAIAATVGIPDLQAFNKACRAVTGSSPRRLRAEPPPTAISPTAPSR